MFLFETVPWRRQCMVDRDACRILWMKHKISLHHIKAYDHMLYNSYEMIPLPLYQDAHRTTKIKFKDIISDNLCLSYVNKLDNAFMVKLQNMFESVSWYLW